jgi:hypothetical protein
MAAMDDDKIDQIIRLLNEATTILTKELPMPDMEIPEWNQTPTGRTISRIAEAIELLTEDE